MKLLNILLSFAPLAALAHPNLNVRAAPPQQVDLVFHAAAAQYEMSIPANGKKYYTNKNNLNVNIIDIPNFLPRNCVFETPFKQALVTTYDRRTGLQSLILGPPQPVISVTCQGTCITTYGDCVRNGQTLGSCCSGFCAANKCRPFITPQN